MYCRCEPATKEVRFRPTRRAGLPAAAFHGRFLRAALFFTPLYSPLRKVAVHALYGTTPQSLLAMLAPCKRSSRALTLVSERMWNRAISETHLVSPRAVRKVAAAMCFGHTERHVVVLAA
jgi:hypothetical protein